MKNFIKNIVKSTRTIKGDYPKEYVHMLEETTDALRIEISKAEDFYRTHMNKVDFPHKPEKYLPLIRDYTDNLAREQENYHGVELYLPFHIGLYLLMRFQKPKIAFETGVERGGSTLALLKGLYENTQLKTPCDGCEPGKLYSFDISNSTRFIRAKSEWEQGKEAKHQIEDKTFVPIGTLIPKWLKNQWNFIVGSSLKNVPKTLKKTGSISFFCAGHSHTYEIQKEEIENVWDHIVSGGIIVIDRSDWEDDKYLKELVKEKDLHNNFVVCKESKHSLKFNYIILVKP